MEVRRALNQKDDGFLNKCGGVSCVWKKYSKKKEKKIYICIEKEKKIGRRSREEERENGAYQSVCQ